MQRVNLTRVISQRCRKPVTRGEGGHRDIVMMHSLSSRSSPRPTGPVAVWPCRSMKTVFLLNLCTWLWPVWHPSVCVASAYGRAVDRFQHRLQWSWQTLNLTPGYCLWDGSALHKDTSDRSRYTATEHTSSGSSRWPLPCPLPVSNTIGSDYVCYCNEQPWRWPSECLMSRKTKLLVPTLSTGLRCRLWCSLCKLIVAEHSACSASQV